MRNRPAAGPTRHQLESFRLTAERTKPTRARAVLWFIDYALGDSIPDRRQRRRSERQGKRHAHPARQRYQATRRNSQLMTGAEREREKLARRMGGMLREELAVAGGEDGEVAGPLRVVARYATPHLLGDFGLEPGEHTAPFEHWLMVRFGDVLRDPDIEGYLRWRRGSVERALGEAA